MSRKIIALSGEAGVGKDTFAIPLIQSGWNHGSFAKNLKLMCQTVFNLPPFLTDTQEGKMKRLSVPRTLTESNFTSMIRWISKTHDLSESQRLVSNIRQEYILDLIKTTGNPKVFQTSREILQFVGTEICRQLSTTYHVDVLLMEIQKTPGNWVITDARFPNERYTIKESFNGTLIRIKRPGFTGRTGSHASEISFGLDEDYDVVFSNDGTIEQLQEEARRYL